jgi:hypothetical protein
MVNDDVIDLYGRTHVGTKVVVLPMGQHHIAKPAPAAAPSHATARGFRASGIY